jgi:hypothetical protein
MDVSGNEHCNPERFTIERFPSAADDPESLELLRAGLRDAIGFVRAVSGGTAGIDQA